MITAYGVVMQRLRCSMVVCWRRVTTLQVGGLATGQECDLVLED
jgi:hypothetical protein